MKGKEGFTIVEIIVTIVVASLFIAAISQLYMTQTKLSQVMSSFSTADLLAYNNLRTYAYGSPPTWFDCVYSGSTPQPMTVLSKTDAVDGLPNPVTQSVIATAPYGCGGSSGTTGYPIKVVSTVSYGPDGKKVVHATYSTY